MQDFYRQRVKEELYYYLKYRDSLEFVSCRIKELEDLKIKSGVTNYSISEGKPSPNGGIFTNEEKAIININSEIDMLKSNRDDALNHIKKMDRAMECLDFKEKDILLSIYGRRGKRDGRLDWLIEKYHFEKSHLYRIANHSLEKVSFRLYGNA